MSSSVVGPGDLIAGRYRIERLLGQGGMGSVYEAVQLSLDRKVALKLLVDEELEHPAHAARFEREAVALSRLNDPHTVRLFDFGVDVGTDERRRPYLVMELLKGCDLASDLERQGPLRWDQALQVSRQVLASLAEAHAAGIVHRDIKPANLFLCASSEWPVVRVLDFGIAASAGDRAARKLTLTGTLLGSAAYMSPEQAQGHEAGPAADLYALGVVLFELLTGRTPFEGRMFTAQLLAKVMERAPALRAVRPEFELPDGVQALVAELLERDVAARPPSARAVAERMAALLERVSLPALPRAVDATPAASQALAAALPKTESGTEPMRVPPTLDNWWPPPETAPLREARPIARAPRGRRALAASALLLGAAVLGWGLRARPQPEGNASALATGAAASALAANPVLELRPDAVIASAADTLRENEAAPSASKSAAPISAGTSQRSLLPGKAQKKLVAAKKRAAQPAAAPKLPAVSAAPAPVPQPRSPENEVAAVPPRAAPLPEGIAVWPLPPTADARPLPRPAAEPAPPRPQRYLGTIESAAAAERYGEVTPAQRDDMIAALSERRQFARSRTIREYREGLIDHAELKTRLREIDREFAGTIR